MNRDALGRVCMAVAAVGRWVPRQRRGRVSATEVGSAGGVLCCGDLGAPPSSTAPAAAWLSHTQPRRRITKPQLPPKSPPATTLPNRLLPATKIRAMRSRHSGLSFMCAGQSYSTFNIRCTRRSCGAGQGGACSAYRGGWEGGLQRLQASAAAARKPLARKPLPALPAPGCPSH